MRRAWRWIPVLATLIGLAALVIWAHSYVSPMVPRASEEWSRGRVIGKTLVNLPVAMCPVPDGGVILIWPNLERRLELARIDGAGKVLLDRVLEVGEGAAYDPQLEGGADGRLHLLWREGSGANSTVRYVELEEDGTPGGESLVLNDPTHEVLDAPRLVLDAAGRLYALWADSVGIRWAVLTAEGGLSNQPSLLVTNGRSPAARSDSRGRLHLAWQQQVGGSTYGVYYAALDPESEILSTPQEMATVFLRTGQQLKGPAIGLDPETGYVLWEVQDMREVSSQGRYAFFPLDLPRQRRVNALRLKQGSDPMGMYPLKGQQSPLLVALSEMVATPGGMEPQIAVIALVQDQAPEYEVHGLAQVMPGGRHGLLVRTREMGTAGVSHGQEAVGWETEHIVTASSRPSVKPVLTADDRGHLHLAWLETGGFGEYRVVYASTAPEVKRAYNALTLWDVVDTVFGGVLRLSVVVLAAIPMFILWALVPLLGLLAYHLATGEEGLESLRSWLVLGLMLVLEVALTFIFPPRVDVAWAPLRWVAPPVATILAAVSTVLVLRRRGDSLLFTSFFLFSGVQGLLQLILYFLF